MALTLTIENETQLPDGGPLSVSVTGKRGIDIGRDSHLDWTLPDPTRFISGKHCEVRYRDGGYWLYDVSTNGTSLYGAEGRLKGPHQLRNGDRLLIGQYIIAVAVDEEGGAAAAAPDRAAQPPSYLELWNPTPDVAPPVERSQVMAPREAPAPIKPDFLDWAVDVPDTFAGERAFAPRPNAASPEDELSWAQGAPTPAPAVEPPPAMPSPRRPVWVSTEPAGPWAAPDVPDSLTGDPAQQRPAEPSSRPFPSPAAALPGERPLAEAPAVPAAPAAPAASSPISAGFMARVAHGAGVPEDVFARRNPDQLAEELGALMRLVVENVRQLLNARLEAKRLARSSNQTMIQALDNNPLKFSPTADDALRIMFGPPTRSYLDAKRALDQSFTDLKAHQLQTFTAMQQALKMLIDDLDPEAIDNDTEAERGIAGMVGSRRAKLWDVYVARWEAKTRRHEGGLVDAFMQYFAECYDRARK